MEQQDAASKNSCPACGPGGFIAGRDVRAAFFWLLFFAVQRKVTRAQRETLWTLKGDAKEQEQEQDQRHPSSILPCAARKGGGNNSNSNSNGNGNGNGNGNDNDNDNGNDNDNDNDKIKMDPSLRWDDGGKN